MKTLKKMNLAILAIVLGFGLVFTQSAFKAAPIAKAPTAYVYDGTTNNLADFKVGTWLEVDEEMPDCDNSGEIVCRISFNGDAQDLHDFLFASGRNAQEVIDLATSTKE